MEELPSGSCRWPLPWFSPALFGALCFNLISFEIVFDRSAHFQYPGLLLEPPVLTLFSLVTMKSFQLVLLAFVVACASAFAPSSKQTVAFSKPLMASKLPEPVTENREKAAAIAAFATSLAPLAAHAEVVDEATVIGYGAGLVACVVSLAVGFAIGYGTLVKL